MYMQTTDFHTGYSIPSCQSWTHVQVSKASPFQTVLSIEGCLLLPLVYKTKWLLASVHKTSCQKKKLYSRN